MATQRRPQPFGLLFVGDDRHPEFREPIGFFRQNTRFTRLPGTEQLLRLLAECDDPVRCIVFSHPRRGCFTQHAVERVRRASPLSVLACLCGAWCEGELRSGRPLAGVHRVMWNRWRGFAARLLDPDSGFWRLPLTATASEILDAQLQWQRAADRPLVAVVARTIHAYEPMADLLASAGYPSEWLPRGTELETRRAASIVWCDPAPHAGDWDDFARVRAASPEVPIVVVAGFPRLAEIERYRRAGASEVLAKPFHATDLLHVVAQLLDARKCAA